MGGGQSQIEATLILLQESTGREQYDYYHFISGQDFPLKTQDEIHNFFDNKQGMEFISYRIINENTASNLNRIKYYYPLENLITSGRIINKLTRIANNGLVKIQKAVHIDRTEKGYNAYAIGANWFSITDRLARYAVSQWPNIKKNFYRGFCADELWLPTIYINSDFYDETSHYHSDLIHSQDHPYIESIYFDVMRAIDFKRRDTSVRKGGPHVWIEEDYDLLKESGLLFCRKVNEKNSAGLLDRLEQDVCASEII